MRQDAHEAKAVIKRGLGGGQASSNAPSGKPGGVSVRHPCRQHRISDAGYLPAEPKTLIGTPGVLERKLTIPSRPG